MLSLFADRRGTVEKETLGDIFLLREVTPSVHIRILEIFARVP